MKYVLNLCSVFVFAYLCFWIYQLFMLWANKAHTIDKLKSGVNYRIFVKPRIYVAIISICIIALIGIGNAIYNLSSVICTFLDICTIVDILFFGYIIYVIGCEIDYRYNFRKPNREKSASFGDLYLYICDFDLLKKLSITTIIAFGVGNIYIYGFGILHF